MAKDALQKAFDGGLAVVGGFIMAYIVSEIVDSLGFSLISSGVTDALVLLVSVALIFTGIQGMREE